MIGLSRIATRTLAPPLAYRAYHELIGSPRLWRTIVEYMEPRDGQRVLDLGCGPGTMAGLLPSVDYTGVELSTDYARRARGKWGDDGRVMVADVTTLDPADLGLYDCVLAHGLLHHLDDRQAASVIELAAGAMAPGGRLVTVDGCYTDEQSRVARFLLQHDRGDHVRTEPEYRDLITRRFDELRVAVRTDLLRVPYTLHIGVGTEPTST